jgi:hypothetical protein
MKSQRQPDTIDRVDHESRNPEQPREGKCSPLNTLNTLNTGVDVTETKGWKGREVLIAEQLNTLTVRRRRKNRVIEWIFPKKRIQYTEDNESQENKRNR